MPKQHIDEVSYGSIKTGDISISNGKTKENAQITVKDTGWTGKEKTHKQHGFDSRDRSRSV